MPSARSPASRHTTRTDALDGAPPPEAELCLLVLGRGDDGLHVLPRSGVVVLGRDPDCDVVIDDRSVSRRHARIELGPPLCLRDLGSSNGVFVQRRRLARDEAVPLALGEMVQLGAISVVLLHSAVYAAAEARRRLAPATPPSGPAPSRNAGSGGDAIVCDRTMEQIYELIERIGASPLSVLLLGETGVGKEVLASAVHERSGRGGYGGLPPPPGGKAPRTPGPLVKLNCAALSPTLLESELFGHEKGAFTGADRAKPGLLESADGGTVFLDEVGEMPLALQVKLLRVLEERAVTRVGALKPRPIDVRFVSATNRDLPAEVARGAFRQDLLFRLNGVTIEVPPLRKRVGEIAPLARLFAERASAAAHRARVPEFASAALAALERYPWPGNVRELRNVVERATALCDGARIELAHLPPELLHARAAAPAWVAPPAAVASAPSHASPATLPPPPAFNLPPVSVAPPAGVPRDDADDAGAASPLLSEMARVEREMILAVLDECAGNQTRAAAKLGISLRTLVRRIEAYGIRRPRK